MKEDFLHYVWKFQKFNTQKLTTVAGKALRIEKVGVPNHNSGPDFFNAILIIDGQKWAGNVEIHIKSSDWYVHHHEEDPAYDSVVLHVVWQHDVAIYRKDKTVIPTLILQDIVATSLMDTYQSFQTKNKKWIACENSFASVDDFTIQNWLERLYLERLEEKTEFILDQLERSNNHWEAVLYKMLFKNFGLKVNGVSFFSIANATDFSIVQKASESIEKLEALFLGQAGLLDENHTDVYFDSLQSNYSYLKKKFQLTNYAVTSPKFFRLRPPNFPTIRLVQLAALYHKNQSLFSEIIAAKNLEEFYTIFSVSASSYWDEHYNFDVLSSKRKKRITKNFVDLLIINTIIPLKFAYAKYKGAVINEQLIALVSSIEKENNSIVTRYNNLKNVAKNALQSQGLLQLHSNYCKPLQCLNCAIGLTILK